MPIAFQNLASVADGRKRFVSFNGSEQEILQIVFTKEINGVKLLLTQVQVQVAACVSFSIIWENVSRQ